MAQSIGSPPASAEPRSTGAGRKCEEPTPPVHAALKAIANPSISGFSAVLEVFAPPVCPNHRNICKLFFFRHASEHQSAPAHVAAAGELLGEEQALAENLRAAHRRTSRWRRCQAAPPPPQARSPARSPGIALQRLAITRIVEVDVDAPKCPQVRQRDWRVKGHQPTVGRDRQRAVLRRRGAGQNDWHTPFFPRKYNPLRKLKTSPSDTPPGSRIRRARSNRAASLNRNPARLPPQ